MAKTKQKQTSRGPLRPPKPSPDEVVDPRWLLKALGIVVASAAALAYLSLCLLIYQGAWQLLLHPSPKVDRTPASRSIPFQAVRFDAAATGRPRLSAWWIPGQADGPTILYLHDGTGSLAGTVDQLASLHQAGVNLLAIDYRGFGSSDPTHPNQSRMTEDAYAALDYLTSTRHVPAESIVPYGVGLGAALAASLAANHAEISALILDNPDPDAATRIVGDRRSRLIPVRLLVRDRFDVATPLRQFRGPKLLFAGGSGETHPENRRSVTTLFQDLRDPKFIVTLPSAVSSDEQPAAENESYISSVRRFLDESVRPQQMK